MARNKNIRFMNNQFATSANATFSSEQATFPFSNVLNERRSKVWSPNGTFIIDDTNNKVYLSTGTIEITITNGTYTGTTLAAQIQTDMNLVSANWTCTYSTSTNRFTLDNPNTSAIAMQFTTNAIWDSIGFITGTELNVGAAFDPAISDEPRIHTEEFIKVDLGVQIDPTFVGLVNPIDELFPISEQGLVTIQANNVDEFDNPALSIVATKTKDGILEHIDSDTEDRSYRYWKIKIVDRTNTSVGSTGFKFGYFYIGDHKTFTKTNVTRGFDKDIEDPSKRFVSESGQEFFQEKIKYHTYKSMSVEVMRGIEREEMEQLFYDFGITQPLFVALDPLNKISLSNDEHTKFMRFASKPTFKHVFLDYYNVSLSLKEVI